MDHKGRSKEEEEEEEEEQEEEEEKEEEEEEENFAALTIGKWVKERGKWDGGFGVAD